MSKTNTVFDLCHSVESTVTLDVDASAGAGTEDSAGKFCFSMYGFP